MSDWGYLPNEYEIAIGEISHRKHLIVEGVTDKRVFKILLDQFHENKNELPTIKKINKDNIDIDCIDDFIKGNNSFSNYNTSEYGNRGKIESIHENVKNSPNYSNLMFFVDREFRYFDCDEIKDDLNQHHVQGSLFWSRGHSIENYLFDSTVLHEGFRILTKIDYFDRVIKIYKKLFYQTMCLATVVSLTLRECKQIQLEDSLDYELIDVSLLGVNLRFDDWRRRLHERKKIVPEETEKILVCFQKWSKIVNSSNKNIDRDTIRWICHGHIGIRIVIEVYKSCTKYICKLVEIENARSQSLKEKDLFKKLTKNIKGKPEDISEVFFNWWASKVVNDINDKYIYPKEIIERLSSNK